MSTLSGGPNIVTDGLILYVDAANPNSYLSGSNTWRDISRGGNNGTLTNGPTFSVANGGSIVFDGVDDYVDNINQTISIQENTPFSIQVIFKGTGTPSQLIGNWNTLVTPGWRLVLESGKIRFYLLLANGNSGRAVSSVLTSYNNGTIYNVIITYDGSSNANNINLYVNSFLISKTVDSNSPVGILTNSKITLGASQINTSSFTNFLNGNIYQTLIYNRALSATEILQNYNATKNRFGL